MTQYTDLVTSEHSDKPKFIAVIEASTQQSIDLQLAFSGFPADFDIDLAVGVQLDAVGKWVGIGRNVSIPLTGVYFAWDTTGLGWDQGVWQGPFDPTQGLSILNDNDYRVLLRATIALNNWDGQIAGAIAAITALFPSNFVYIQDNFDMSMIVAVAGPPVSPVLGALLTGGYLALKPDAVHINYMFASAPTGPVFGYDAENSYISGWDVGSWGAPTPFPS